MTTNAFAAAEGGPHAEEEIRHILSEKDATAIAALRIQVAVVVMSPWTDLALTGASMNDRANEDPLVTKDMLSTAATGYLAGHDPLDPVASPPHANLRSSTPLQLRVGTSEVLLDDSRRHARRFRNVGGNAVVHMWEGMMDVFPSNMGMLEASDAAVAVMSAFIKENLIAVPE